MGMARGAALALLVLLGGCAGLIAPVPLDRAATPVRTVLVEPPPAFLHLGPGNRDFFPPNVDPKFQRFPAVRECDIPELDEDGPVATTTVGTSREVRMVRANAGRILADSVAAALTAQGYTALTAPPAGGGYDARLVLRDAALGCQSAIDRTLSRYRVLSMEVTAELVRVSDGAVLMKVRAVNDPFGIQANDNRAAGIPFDPAWYFYNDAPNRRRAVPAAMRAMLDAAAGVIVSYMK